MTTPPPPVQSSSSTLRTVALVALIAILVCSTPLFLLLAACGAMASGSRGVPGVVLAILLVYFVIAGLCIYGIGRLVRAGRGEQPPREVESATGADGDRVSDQAASRLRWAILAQILLSLVFWAMGVVESWRSSYNNPRWQLVGSILWLIHQVPYGIALFWLDPARDRGRRILALVLALSFSVVGILLTLSSLGTLLMRSLASTTATQLARMTVGILPAIVVAALATTAWRERRRPDARNGLLLASFVVVLLYDLFLRSVTGWLYAALAR
jgi:hypothetical protein